MGTSLNKSKNVFSKVVVQTFVGVDSYRFALGCHPLSTSPFLLRVS